MIHYKKHYCFEDEGIKTYNFLYNLVITENRYNMLLKMLFLFELLT